MKTLTEIRKEIEPALQKIEKSRLKKKATLEQAQMFLVIPIIIFIILVGVFVMTSNPFWIVGGLAISIIMFNFIYFQLIPPIKKEFKEEFKTKILPTFVQAVFPNAKLKHRHYISEGIFKDSNLFNNFNKYTGEDLFLGTTANGAPFQFSELTVEKISTGKKKKSTIIFKGLFFKKKKTNKRVYILPDIAEKNFGNLGAFFQENINNSFRGAKMIPIKEQPKFEKEYIVYAQNKKEGRSVLTPTLAGLLYSLRFKWKTALYLAIDGNEIYIAIPDKKDNFEAKINQSILKNHSIKRLYNKLSMCFTLIEDFSTFDFDIKNKLDTPNWQNEAYKHFNDANNSF